MGVMADSGNNNRFDGHQHGLATVQNYTDISHAPVLQTISVALATDTEEKHI